MKMLRGKSQSLIHSLLLEIIQALVYTVSKNDFEQNGECNRRTGKNEILTN